MPANHKPSAAGGWLGIICLGFVCILLIAGLAPFHSPRNQVEWLTQRGLKFNRYSSVVSSGVFNQSTSNLESIELWIVPSSERSTNVILAMSDPDHVDTPFVVRQYKNALVIGKRYRDAGADRVQLLAVAKAFQQGKPVLVTVTWGEQGTSIYLDGQLRESFPSLGAAVNNLRGSLVLGNSPRVNDSWSGEVLRLAMYENELGASEVAQHAAQWARSGRPVISESDSAIALYLFDEGRGNTVRNQVNGSTNLLIPERYLILHPRLFASVKQDYRANRQYWEDIALNVAGFIPMGFLLTLYFSEVRGFRHPMVTAVLLGLSVSFTIEALQVFLPTRSSGSTDLITNTVGTVVGTLIYQLPTFQALCKRIFDRETSALIPMPPVSLSRNPGSVSA